jgi:hypothetical protein
MADKEGKIHTFGAHYHPLTAEHEARIALAKDDRRLAHDILWDASENGPGKNGWCIPDRGALNAVVNEWPNRSDQDLDAFTYANIKVKLQKASKPAPTLVENYVTKVTASFKKLGSKEGQSGYIFREVVSVGSTTTESTDKKISVGISAGLAGLGEVSVSVSVINKLLHDHVF